MPLSMEHKTGQTLQRSSVLEKGGNEWKGEGDWVNRHTPLETDEHTIGIRPNHTTCAKHV